MSRRHHGRPRHSGPTDPGTAVRSGSPDARAVNVESAPPAADLGASAVSAIEPIDPVVAPASPEASIQDQAQAKAPEAAQPQAQAPEAAVGAVCDACVVENYSTRMPLMARAITSCWISDVPSKIVWILASRCQRSTGYSRV